MNPLPTFSYKSLTCCATSVANDDAEEVPVAVSTSAELASFVRFIIIGGGAGATSAVHV